MQFGLFGSAQADSSGLGAGVGQGFRDYIDFNVEAEALGYCSTFLVEHHFTGWGQVSSTLNLLTWLAARTSTLRLGTATMVLPWHNPVLLAEQVSTLELLSNGRFDFGVGRGYRHAEFSGFNIPMEESEGRFEECLDVMLKAWSGDGRFSHRGKYWCFNDILVEPSIERGPAMWMGAGSESSIRKVASRGFNLLLDQFADATLTGQRIQQFRQALSDLGRAYDPNAVAVARELYVATDDDDKLAAIERLNAARKRTINHAQAPGKAGGAHILSYANGSLPPTDSALIGTPDEIREMIRALHDAGANYLILTVLGGSLNTLRRFAHEIMPEFQAAV
ncbi:LLM class flavin-dependent oxidoreductase [Pandoraea anhela]|uniref:Luciferase n=1 Tax=Pandoraea anhela TaxID=2508295 RepID=A0A5E4WFK7_9BURK|nr:LLM class flavin-dependent oxidoreductase [Pandoraea anhela]VVE23562.1 luciferase [Pandoraea anhela]